MKKIFISMCMALAVLAVGCGKEEEAKPTPEPEQSGVHDANGALKSAFSVSATQKVRFSMGNLQYQASTNTWRFALNQYDMMGEDNANVSATNDGWIDLFGWGTSGWDNGNRFYHPYDVAENAESNYGNYYGPAGEHNITGDYANADWGVYNEISNGGEKAGLWRTLSYGEWRYLLFSRESTELITDGDTINIRFVKATVNGVAGLILFPDVYQNTVELNRINAVDAAFATNNLDADAWETMEKAGCVFLPAAGSRGGTNLYVVGEGGRYWTSSCSGVNGARNFGFGDLSVFLNPENRSGGFSVRLVQNQ